MKKLLPLFLILISNILFAQEQCVPLFPGTEKERQDMEQFISFAKSTTDLDKTIRIPIVLHVYHVTKYLQGGFEVEEGLVSKEQLWSAMDDLNQAYNAYFATKQEESFDTNIEFYLANMDEDGNYIDGIFYHDIDTVPWLDSLERQKAYDDGFYGSGLSTSIYMTETALDINKYLNVHVVYEISGNGGGGGIQGFAWIPGTTLPSFFGQTNLDNVMGLPGDLFPGYYDYNGDGVADLDWDLKSYTDENDTYPHEVGHNLGLYHTFTGNSCLPEDDCTAEGDFVCDTEPTTQTSSCGGSCAEWSTPNSNVNYMSYTNCRTRFTEGQNERARTFLSTLLLPLKTSIDSGYAYKPRRTTVEVTPIEVLSGCQDDKFLKLKIKNTGDSLLTNLKIVYGNTVANADTIEWVMNIGPGLYKYHYIPAIEGQTRNRKIKVLEVNTLPQPQPIQSVQVPVGSLDIVIESIPDCIGAQNYWQIIDLDAQEVVAERDPYPNFENPNVFTDQICLPSGNYQFILHDVNGNGWSTSCSGSAIVTPYMKVYLNGNLCNEITGTEFIGSAWTFTTCGVTNLQESSLIEYYDIMSGEYVDQDEIVPGVQFRYIIISTNNNGKKERNWYVLTE